MEGPGASLRGCPIEVSVAALHQPRLGVFAVSAIGLRAKAVKRSQCACRGDLEDRAITVRAAPEGCPVEVPVGGLNHAGVRIAAVSAVMLRAKTVQRGERA